MLTHLWRSVIAVPVEVDRFVVLVTFSASFQLLMIFAADLLSSAPRSLEPGHVHAIYSLASQGAGSRD